MRNSKTYSNLKPADAQTTVDKIEALWIKGEPDEKIANTLNITVPRVTAVRSIFGMRKQHASMFDSSRPLKFLDFSEKFIVPAFSLPYDIAEKLKLDTKKSYEIFASVQGKDQIVITINRKL